MLSIVKLDLDTGGGEIHESEMDDQGDYSTGNRDSQVMNSLELIPMVYTTRLDDMAVLKRHNGLQPNEVTARILRESKPLLCDYLSDDHAKTTRCRKNSFRSLKTKLNRIYKANNNLDGNEDIKPDVSSIKIEDCFLKQGESEEINASCKYRELLKLCRPVSVVLTKMTEYPETYEQKDVRTVTSKNSQTVTIISSSDEDEPLVKSNPVISHNNKLANAKSEIKVYKNKTSSSTPSNEAKDNQQAFLNFTGNRLLLNGLMEMHDFYSQEFNSYITDAEGLLLDYYTGHIEDVSKYEHIQGLADTRLTFLNCCWVQRDQYIRSMYPRVLMYTNFRFMRKQHLCPLGECICCCRNKKEFLKPDLPRDLMSQGAHSDDNASVPPPYLKEDLEIQALEDEIEKSIINMNKAPRLNTTEWLRALLTVTKSRRPGRSLLGMVAYRSKDNLIDKALLYEKRLPKKQADNRHLLTMRNESTQSKVLIFRNFATNLKEVYELDSYGVLQSYVTMPCFSNTTRPDIKKLTSASKSVRDVCCWFKREHFIAQLLRDRTLEPSAAKFIRSRHTCSLDACSCCCKPASKKVGIVQLRDISIPSQLHYWNTLKEHVKSSTTPSSDTNADVTPSVADNSVLKTTPSDPQKVHALKHLKRLVASPSTASQKTNVEYKNTSASPVPQPEPTTSNPLPPEQVKHIANVLQGEEMSGEVNTLIISILERFKDVRLSISGDGKVAAALNTPVNTLSTVELKVLANILSYAQSQINLLGLNSGMSLSSIINMKKSDNADKNAQSAEGINPTQRPINVGYRTHFPVLTSADTKDAYEYFTKTLSARNKAFKEPFSSFLAERLNVSDSQKSQSKMVIPVIQNVFSLKKEEIDETQNDTSTLWYNKPADEPSDNSGSTSKVYTYNHKRTQKNIESSIAPKRIRVVSPSKLGAPVTVEPEPETEPKINIIIKPTPLLNPGTQGSLVPGVPLLSNPNLRLVVNPTAQLLGMNTVVIPSSNIPVATVSSSERTLVITPLPPLNSLAPFPTVAVVDSNVSQVQVAVPVAESATVTPVPAVSSSNPVNIIPEAPSDAPVDNDDNNDDDVCILGM